MTPPSCRADDPGQTSPFASARAPCLQGAKGVVIARRTFLIGATAAALGIPAVRAVYSRLAPLPEFEDIQDPPGFRRVAEGPVSLRGNIWVGLDEEDAAPSRASIASVRADLCHALFGEVGSPPYVSIASFSDYYCPYCRMQTKHLAELASDPASQIRITWHELPLLGHASNVAARAALAAKKQGAYPQFHDRLLGSPFQPTPSYLRSVSEEIGLDADQLLTDMASPDIRQELERSAALAEIFALIGTPAMVIGRTVVQGRIPDRVLLKIIENERRTGWAQVCRQTA